MSSREQSESNTWSRRSFLKKAGLAAGAAALLATPFVFSNLDKGEKEDDNDEFIYGVTLDSIDNLDTTVEVLNNLPERPTTRIVFDEYIHPEQYNKAVAQIRPTSDIMGEVLDSYYVKEYSQKDYEARVHEYVNAFIGQIAIWEIGNEINGEWLKKPSESRSVVADKIEATYDIVNASGGQTAITLYYNQGCWSDPKHKMFRWVDEELSDEIKNGVDYVFISYYEEDCNNLQPDWQNVFERLSRKFPNSKLGFGEVGLQGGSTEEKIEYLERYYSTRPDVDNFVGGYFWWYFKQDMVDAYAGGDKRMVNALSEAMK